MTGDLIQFPVLRTRATQATREAAQDAEIAEFTAKFRYIVARYADLETLESAPAHVINLALVRQMRRDPNKTALHGLSACLVNLSSDGAEDATAATVSGREGA